MRREPSVNRVNKSSEAIPDNAYIQSLDKCEQLELVTKYVDSVKRGFLEPGIEVRIRSPKDCAVIQLTRKDIETVEEWIAQAKEWAEVRQVIRKGVV